MMNDLKRLLPWLAIPLVLALLAVVSPGLFRSSLLEGEQAPNIELEIVAGEGLGDRIVLDQQRGRVVILDFWASWCQPCRQTVPILNELAAKYRGKPLSIYGVNVEPELGPRRLGLVHQSFGSVFPSGQDRTGEMQRKYQVTSLPTVVVIDREGHIRRAQGGVPMKVRLESLLDQLL